MTENTELVREAQSGNVHAFSLLYETIYKDLYRFAACTLRTPQDAEDAVSEAVTEAFAQIASLRDASAFRAWMFRILTFRCRRKIRQYSRSAEELSESLFAAAPDLEEHFDVRRAFEMLPDEDRLILSMNLFAGYSSQEIGLLIGMNANTVRSRQSRALQKMKAVLSPSDTGE